MPHVNNGFAHTFNDAVGVYDKMRPGYTPELYRDIFVACPMGPESRALEIGIGTGQATGPVLDTGCALTAVELGDKLADFCREKFKDHPGFTVVTGDFMDFDAPGGSFDLIYSATAFHWLPEEAGYRKVFDLLKPGGVFARFANHPYGDKGNLALAAAIQGLYGQYMGRSKAPEEFTLDQARQLAALGEKYGFCDISCSLYIRTRSFSAEEYPLLLNTYSDHLALPEEVRAAFYQDVTQAINAHGGVITLYDTMDLELYRKPASSLRRL